MHPLSESLESAKNLIPKDFDWLLEGYWPRDRKQLRSLPVSGCTIVIPALSLAIFRTVRLVLSQINFLSDVFGMHSTNIFRGSRSCAPKVLHGKHKSPHQIRLGVRACLHCHRKPSFRVISRNNDLKYRLASAPSKQEAGGDTDETTENSSEEDSPGVKAALALLKGYKSLISPLLQPACRYIPTCSEYSMDAFKKFGVSKGILLTAWRLMRCNPFGGRGFDPVRWPPPGLEALFK